MKDLPIITTTYNYYKILGVTKLLMKLWFDKSNHTENWYIGRKDVIDKIAKSLDEIQVPSEISRVPRSLIHRKFFKGI